MSGPTDDGPECETCGKTTCPDADLASFSAPINCEFAPIYQALRYARDCDYGCARDLTNQGVRREVVPVVERIVAARLAEQVERIAQAIEAQRIVCPVHGIPDCSPLLNGCDRPRPIHLAVTGCARIARQSVEGGDPDA